MSVGGCCPTRVVLVLGSVIVFAAACGPSPESAAPATSASASAPPAAPPLTVPLERQGTFGRYSFIAKKSGDTAIAVFTPFLPRDDKAFLGGASAATQAVFDAALEPSSARLTGQGEVAVSAKGGGTFYLFPVKEDTGEVHSIRIRRGE